MSAPSSSSVGLASISAAVPAPAPLAPAALGSKQKWRKDKGYINMLALMYEMVETGDYSRSETLALEIVPQVIANLAGLENMLKEDQQEQLAAKPKEKPRPLPLHNRSLRSAGPALPTVFESSRVSCARSQRPAAASDNTGEIGTKEVAVEMEVGGMSSAAEPSEVLATHQTAPTAPTTLTSSTFPIPNDTPALPAIEVDIEVEMEQLRGDLPGEEGGAGARRPAPDNVIDDGAPPAKKQRSEEQPVVIYGMIPLAYPPQVLPSTINIPSSAAIPSAAKTIREVVQIAPAPDYQSPYASVLPAQTIHEVVQISPAPAYQSPYGPAPPPPPPSVPSNATTSTATGSTAVGTLAAPPARTRAPKPHSHEQRTCGHCGVISSLAWRSKPGPDADRCERCGERRRIRQ